MTGRQKPGPALGPVTVIGAHILDVLGRPVETIPPGQGSVRLSEIRATAAGTAAGTAVDLAKLGASVLAIGALGDDLLGDMVAAAMARHGIDTSGLGRKPGVQTSATILPIRANGERPALHVPAPRRSSSWPTSTWTGSAPAGPCSSALPTRSAPSSATCPGSPRQPGPTAPWSPSTCCTPAAPATSSASSPCSP